MRAMALAALVSLAFPLAAAAQQFETEPRPKDEARPIGYLGAEPVDYRLFLLPPPAPGSPRDLNDQLTIWQGQDASRERYDLAQVDSEFLYPRFFEAFGGTIDRTSTPALITLLNRAMRDVSKTTFDAKGVFQRPRPYQRMPLRRVCGEDPPPKPEPTPTTGSSYPSGHTSYGWATAMILARVRPDRTPQLLARAAEYSESRAVCAVHFPSDLEAGRLVAAAVVSRLDADPAFRADLARARSEVGR